MNALRFSAVQDNHSCPDMNNKELLSVLSRKTNAAPAEVQERINALNSVVSSLSEDETLSIKGFGTFEVKKRMERVAANPSTGRKVLVPPKLVLVFRPATALKEAVNGRQPEM